jgi:CRISPR/Cas system-associated protein Cas5 (RAMP superfamily)
MDAQSYLNATKQLAKYKTIRDQLEGKLEQIWAQVKTELKVSDYKRLEKLIERHRTQQALAQKQYEETIKEFEQEFGHRFTKEVD